MNTVRLILTLILAASILCAMLLIQYAYKRRSMPGAKYFILLLISAIVYNGAYLGEINSNNISTAMFWFHIQHIPIPIQHYLWMVMSLEYSKVQGKYLKLAKYLGLYHPIVYMLIYFTNDFHKLYISKYSFISNGHFPVLFTTKESLYILMVASGTLLGVVSMVFYVRGLIKSSRLHQNSYIIMIIASIFPWITVYLNASDTNFLGIDYFPVLSIISGCLYILGIFKFKIFNTIPIATEIVFRQSKEGVLLIDLDDQIIDANDAVVELYPELKGLSSKYCLGKFVKDNPEIKRIYEGQTVFQYSLNIQGSERYYSAEVAKIVLEDGLEIGKILTINDITIHIENQRMLEQIAATAIDKAETSEISFLQAQINPHFLNNTLSVIGSMVTRDPHGAKELIGNLGEYLANRCYFDSTSPMVLLDQELDAVNTYVAIEKARFGDRLRFQIVCDKVSKINIPRLILQPLVENSIKHGILKRAEGGNICLSIVKEGCRIFFEVRDDGVGISEEMIHRLMLGGKENIGIGIYNIHRRLVKHYGEGLQIESIKGKGTTVSFYINI